MKRGKSPSVAPDDAALFRDAVGTVVPVTHTLAEQRPTPPPPRAHKSREDDEAVKRELATMSVAELELAISDPLSYARNGVDARVLKRLGRGEYAIADEIDLHHMTVAQAQPALAEFLNEARRARHLCVKVIHGKGLRSKSEIPVLKLMTDRVLRQRGDVIAYRSARAADGGSGAVIVLLRRD